MKTHITEIFSVLTPAERLSTFGADAHEKMQPYYGNVDSHQWSSLVEKHPELEHQDVPAQHKILSDLHSGFSNDEQYSIKDYTKGGSGYVNELLIHGHKSPRLKYVKTKQILDHISKLDQVIEKVKPLDHNVHAFSSVGFNPHKLMQENDGLFKTPAFISTSINPHIAVDFNIFRKGFKHDGNSEYAHHVVHFDLPKGYTGGLYVGDHASPMWSHQKELIIDRNRIFKLHKRHTIIDGDHKLVLWHVKPADHHFIPESIDSVDVIHEMYVHKHKTLGTGLKTLQEDAPALQIAADKLHNIIRESKPLESDIHVYSGIKYKPGLKEGDIFHLPTFTSTSLPIAREFGDHKYKGTKPGDIYKHVSEHQTLHFHLPKGYDRGVYIGHKSPYENEHEFLLDKGQKWQVTSRKTIQKDGFEKRTQHIWTVVPHNPLIHEALVHDPDSDIFSDFEFITPARTKANEPEFKAEHTMLSKLHRINVKETGSYTTLSHMTSSSSSINRALIDSSLSKHPMHKKVVDKITELIDNTSPLTNTHHVYSGLGFNPTKIFEEHNGIFKTPAFLSTSLSPLIAVGHNNLNHLGSSVDQHTLHFELPEGYKGGLYVAPHSHFKGEYEMLLSPNQKWKLTKHTKYEDNLNTRHVWSVKPYEA